MMRKPTVKSSDLKWLVNFLNEDLSDWDRNANRDRWDNFDKRMLHTYLSYMTGNRDTSETLAAVQQDISHDVLNLLDPDVPPEEALDRIIDRIEEAKLTGFRRVIQPSEIQNTGRPYTVVDLLRVHPPATDIKGRRPRKATSVAICEGNYDDSARRSFYRILDGAIRNNTVSTLRNCIHCKKFFLQEGGRITYCSPSCESAWNQKRRTAAGYFKDKMKERRRILQQEKKKRGRQDKQQRRIAQFEQFLKKAGSKSGSKEESEVLPIVKSLGGWKIVEPLCKRYRSGELPSKIWNSLQKSAKDMLPA
jgi:hypothetical protein